MTKTGASSRAAERDAAKERDDGEGAEEIEQGGPQAEGGEGQEERLQPIDEGRHRGHQALTPRLLGAFFAFAAAMCLLAGASLLTPGGPLDGIWRVKPDEHRRLLEMGSVVGFGFLGLVLVMTLASLGAFARRRWALPLAMAIFALNAVGDAARIPFGAPAEGLFGILVTAAILWWLARPPVRVLFDR